MSRSTRVALEYVGAGWVSPQDNHLQINGKTPVAFELELLSFVRTAGDNRIVLRLDGKPLACATATALAPLQPTTATPELPPLMLWENLDGTVAIEHHSAALGRVSVAQDHSKDSGQAADKTTSKDSGQPPNSGGSLEHLGLTTGKFTEQSEYAAFRLHVDVDGRWTPIAWHVLRQQLVPGEGMVAAAPPTDAPHDPVLGPYFAGRSFPTNLVDDLRGHDDWVAPFTLTLWIKPPAVAAAERTAILDVSGIFQYSTFPPNCGFPLFHPKPGDGQQMVPYAPNALCGGRWAHIALVWDGRTTAAMYVDGVLINTTCAPRKMMIWNAAIPLVVRTDLFRGRVARLRCWRGVVLGEAEVRRQFADEFPELARRPLICLPLDRIYVQEDKDQKAIRWSPDQGPFPASPARLDGDIADAVDDLLGHSLKLHGAAERVVIPKAVRRAVHGGLDRMLLETWVQLDGPSLSKGTMSIFAAGKPGFDLGLFADATSYSFRWTSGNTTEVVASKTPPASGVWTHLAVVWDGMAITLFVDGQAAATKPWTTPLPWGEPQEPQDVVLGGASPLPGGTATMGFVGQIARVRLLPTLPKSPGDLAAEVRRRIEVDLASAATGALAPLEFALLNDDAEPVLYLSDAPQNLTVELRNAGRQAIDLPDPASSHGIELRFRPGALVRPEAITIAANSVAVPSQLGANPAPAAPTNSSAATAMPNVASPGGNWRVVYRREVDGTDTFALYAGRVDSLRPGEVVRIGLQGVQPDRRGGARTSRVQLRYHLSVEERYPLEGSRLHSLSIVQLSEAQIQRKLDDVLTSVGKGAAGSLAVGEQVKTLVETDKLLLQERGIELSASIVGTPSVVCDGLTKNRLAVRIANSHPFPIPLSKDAKFPTTFRILLETSERVAWGLWRAQDLPSVSSATKTEGWSAAKQPDNSQVVVTNTSHDTFAAAGQSGADLLVELREFTCHGIPAQALLHIEFTNIGAPDKDGVRLSGHVAVPVLRTTIHSRAVGSSDTAQSRTILDGDVTITRAGRIALHASGLNSLLDADGNLPTNETVENKNPTQLELNTNLKDPISLAKDQVQEALVVRAYSAVVAAETGLSYSGHPGHLVPRGTIVMWSNAHSRSKASNSSELDQRTGIPLGWALCDGSNGTPDLKDRFILAVGEPNLSDKPLDGDSHDHHVSIPQLNGGSSESGKHSHAWPSGWHGQLFDNGKYTGIDIGGNWQTLPDAGDHSHSVYTYPTTTYSNSVGPLKPRSYSLCFIMKL